MSCLPAGRLPGHPAADHLPARLRSRLSNFFTWQPLLSNFFTRVLRTGTSEADSVPRCRSCMPACAPHVIPASNTPVYPRVLYPMARVGI